MCCGCRFFVSAVPNRRNKKMAESMKGLKRTCRCAEVTKADIGKKVTLMGWVQKSRNKGGIIFVDLRDRSGIIQLMILLKKLFTSTTTMLGSLQTLTTVSIIQILRMQILRACLRLQKKLLKILRQPLITS